MINTTRLERAVVSIYPEIHRRVTSSVDDADERLLWKELSCCVLSSQVRYPVAVAAAEALERQAVLCRQGASADALESVLRSPLLVDCRVHHYRFPKSKAQQLAATHAAVHSSANGLLALLDGFSCAEEARRWFVANASGIGPKQASMFLRNTGMTYDLAVLDRHVIDYMNELGISRVERPGALSTLKGYSNRETVLKSYAHDLGMAVGLMDWAIWIVMRVFKAGNGKVAYS
ncbi:DNA lyase [Pararhizobium sp. LjRoot255]|uniref:8-oxoguanine DNA glycosylase n=1 Tax=Pararhizobium sp. LjRoot255 TaxID=3342298 RepID=UPI003ECC359F